MTNAAFPEAIILACWVVEDPLLRQLQTDPALTPIGDKPMLRRVLEKLIDLGCRRIAVVHGDRPQQGEALLGDGERWGCRITHHYAAVGSKPLRLLARLVPADEKNCILASADTVPLANMNVTRPWVACSRETGELRWTGWATLPGKTIRFLAEEVQNGGDLGLRIISGLDPSQTPMLITETISTASVPATLDSLPRLFDRSPGAGGINRLPYSDGIWIGKGSRIHPSAQLHPPVFIGQNVLVAENAQIGPYASIGDGCIIDNGSHIEDSVLLANTYVGQQLEVNQAMLAGSRLVNARLGVAVQIPDPEFLRDIARGDRGMPRVGLTQRSLAALLWLALAPLGAMRRLRPDAGVDPTTAAIGFPAQAAGAYRSSTVRFAITHEDIYAARKGAWTRHFLATFLPGLADVIAGKVALVGLQPRTVTEIVFLPDYWQRLYRGNPAGLVSEVLTQGPDGACSEMRYAGDVLCAGPMPLGRVLHVLGRYAARVIAEVLAAKRLISGTSRNTVSQPTH